MTREFIQENLLSETGRLKRKAMLKLGLLEEVVYIKFHSIDNPKCEKKGCNNNVSLKSFTKGFNKFCGRKCQDEYAKTFVNTEYQNIKKEEITKEYIEENVLDKNNNLNANISRFLPVSNEELYLIYYGIEKPKCLNCDNIPTFRKFSEGYYDYCSVECAQKSEITRKKQGDTLFERYGTRDPLEIKDGRIRGIIAITSDEVIKRTQEKNMIKFGGKTSFSSKDVQDKVKTTFEENYGVGNPMFNKEFLVGFTEILNTTRVDTYLEIYGETHPMKNDTIKEKMVNSSLIKDESGLNSHDRRRLTNEVNGYWITEDQVQNFKDYRKLVWRYTNQNDLSILENIELRAHTKEGYHLDHKYSIFQGYKDKIEARIIGNICNLEMLISGQNLSKSSKCSITKEDLLYSYNNK